MGQYDKPHFSILLGKTITAITGCEKGGEAIQITTSDGGEYELYHDQDCCENVEINDVCGNVSDLIGRPLLIAEEVESTEKPEGEPEPSESATWTFYKLATAEGGVTIRWIGESNGYYSESVNFHEIKAAVAA